MHQHLYEIYQQNQKSDQESQLVYSADMFNIFYIGFENSIWRRVLNQCTENRPISLNQYFDYVKSLMIAYINYSTKERYISV